MSNHPSPTEDTTAVFQFGEFTFDCGSRLLLRGGEERRLSPKAQQLLRLLLLARPRALSREELYDALWPSTFVCETNMAGIVNELRRALDDDPRKPAYIRTVHGFGYAFCGEVSSATPTAFVAAVLICEGRHHPLYEGENIVGRAPDCRVVLTHSTVSRRHALITVGEEIWVRDLDSKNGTYVDGRKITASPITRRDPLLFGHVVASLAPRTMSATWSAKLDLTEVKRKVAEQLAQATA